MSCINCDDCPKNLYAYPECDTGVLIIESDVNIKYVIFEKSGGARIVVPQDGGSKVANIDFQTDLDAEFFREASGLITVYLQDANSEPIDIVPANGAENVPCALIYFKTGLPDAAEMYLNLPVTV